MPSRHCIVSSLSDLIPQIKLQQLCWCNGKKSKKNPRGSLFCFNQNQMVMFSCCVKSNLKSKTNLNLNWNPVSMSWFFCWKRTGKVMVFLDGQWSAKGWSATLLRYITQSDELIGQDTQIGVTTDACLVWPDALF